jgi:RNA polymerase sigma-70 factor, ECF subfamily
LEPTVRDHLPSNAVDPLSRLAHAAAGGDEQALNKFVQATYQQVWQLCSALVDRQSASDLAQEVLLKAVRALPTYRGEANARTWLLAIARHTCQDELRARYRHRQQQTLTHSIETAAALHHPDQHLLVQDLLRHLQPDRRTAFVLTQVIGLSYHEAAQICNCPTGTIRSRVARARADLIDALDHGEQPHRASPRGRTDSA